jgi:CubicO group peptidase (beta-lactamase class C family)
MRAPEISGSCDPAFEGVRRAFEASIPAARAGRRRREPRVPTRFGAGSMLSQSLPLAASGPNPGSLGHLGAGGSVGFADPEARIGFGDVMNRMGPHILLDPRADRWIDAVYDALA